MEGEGCAHSGSMPASRRYVSISSAPVATFGRQIGFTVTSTNLQQLRPVGQESSGRQGISQVRSTTTPSRLHSTQGPSRQLPSRLHLP